jgi:uncharacterized protein
MIAVKPSAPWEPVRVSERYTALDLVRGFALFGVLLVNLLYFFRLSLFQHILVFHSHAGWANRAVDVLVAELLEFKAFDLFSLTFGIGVAVQAERAKARGAEVEVFLLRRFLILLVFGACHLLLVSNVDILTLYAVCGLVMIVVLRLPAPVLAIAGLAAVYLPGRYLPGPDFPSEAAMRAHVVNATRMYSQGGFGELLAFRWQETRELIAPLLIGVAPKTLGLMLIGVAVWRSGAVREPQRRRRLLWAICLAGAAVGLVNTTADVMSHASGKPVHVPAALEFLGSHVPLAFAYGAALLAWRRGPRAQAWTAPVAAAGRMALTNYLAQSLIFCLVFYGYGFGWFGRMGTAAAAMFGVAVYAGQLWFSEWWLERYHFGPFEWLWRSMTYGCRQPMRPTG